MTLKEAINNLSKEDRARLMYAFEQEITSWINLANDSFVGVNIIALPQLQILEEQGSWAYGRTL